MEEFDDPYGIRRQGDNVQSTTSRSSASAEAARPAPTVHPEPARPSQEAGPSSRRLPDVPPISHPDTSLEDAPEQSNQDVMNDHLKDRYYALLNVDREASPEQIRDAYRSLAIACHPDKHTGEEAKTAAQARFHEIQAAYDVLSNRESRTIYDHFGEEGLNFTWTVAVRDASVDQLKAEFEMQQARQKAEAAEGKGTSSAEYTAQYDASSFFAPAAMIPRMPDRLDKPVSLQDRLRASRALALAGRHGWEIFSLPFLRLDVTGEMSVRGNRLGEGLFCAKATSVWSPKLSTQVRWSLVGPRVATLDAIYQMDEFTSLSAGISAPTLAIPPSFNISVQQRLSAKSPLTGFASVESGVYSLGPWGESAPAALSMQMGRASLPLFALGLTNPNPDGSAWTVSSQLGLQDFAVDLSRSIIAKWLGGTKLSTSIHCGAFSGAKVSASGERAVTERTKVSFGMAMGLPSGVVVQLGVRHPGRVIKVPIVLSRGPRTDLAFLAAVIPLAGVFALENLYLGPKKRQRKSNRLAELRKQNKDFITERRQAAREGVRVLRGQAVKRASIERSKAGLIILNAHYGREDALPLLPSLQDAEDLDRSAWSTSALDEAEAQAQAGTDSNDVDLYCDVKIPLQAIVSGSKLIVPGGRSKSNLLGFYDPAMGEKKVLRVRYLFRGKVHEAIFADREAVAAPLRSHQL